MSIEKNIERIAIALESLASGAVDIGVVVKLPDAITDEAQKPVEADIPAAPAAPAPRKQTRKPKPAAAAPPATDVPLPPPAITADMVREALRVFLKGDDETLPQQAKAILEEFGSPSVTALDPQHFAAVLGRLTGASA